MLKVPFLEGGEIVAKVTVSIIKADIGSLAGHHIVYDECIDAAENSLQKGVDDGVILDYYVTNCGDDLELIMTHRRGELNTDVHKLAWDTFLKAAEIARELKLYAAGQDLLKDTFSGNVKGMGPGVAELEFEERRSDPIICFMADKTEPGAFNLPMYKIFADPFNTAGLIIDPSMHDGFVFEVYDIIEHQYVRLLCPEELYDLLAIIGTPGRYVVRKVYKKDGTPAAAVSTTRLSLIAGKYVGKDDPCAIVRAQHGLPAVGEVLEPFAFPFLVAGWMRGSHNGPLMPVSQEDAKCTRFDGPPRILALGFQVSDGKLTGPADLFDDPAFDEARRLANQIADYMRRHGPFMPHRLGPEEIEYTTLPQVIEKLKDKFVKEKE
ncbi:MAG: fructose 1,6-bisphosphatase [Candidatus Freyarchaeota archaeon]|nr:fructose 1,6-bisphosphatase [Candidatus Jordarchaeia archaeon]